jgi:6-phosphogluconolactonase
MMRWKDMLMAAVVTLSAGLAQADLVYVGTQGKQLSAMRFDPSEGKLAMIGPVAEGLRPTWTVAHPKLPVLYAVNDENTQEGSVTAFAVNRETGALNKMNQVTTGGNGATYLWFDAPSSTLLAANFAGGSASSIAVNPDGSVGARVSTIKATGSGPHRRQASPHAHSVAIDPSGRYALVPDLGADRVFVYEFNRATHALSPDDAATPRSYIAAAGSGPRHLAFGTDERYVYLLNELTAEIITLRWDPQQGRLTQVQTQQISSPEFSGTRSGAEVAVSGDGRFVYVGDRGEGTLVVYEAHPDTGELKLVQRISTGGETPWGFAIHPSGKWLLIAHQRSGEVNVFGIDPATGKVADTGQSVATPTPVSITFVK